MPGNWQPKSQAAQMTALDANDAHEIHERVLLEISGRVTSGIRHDVRELLRRDVQRLQAKRRH